MAYKFQHPEHTAGEIETIGDTETEAYSYLRDLDLDLEDIFNLVYEGYVWKEQG